jgi:hypothetical protein
VARPTARATGVEEQRTAKQPLISVNQDLRRVSAGLRSHPAIGRNTALMEIAGEMPAAVITRLH